MWTVEWACMMGMQKSDFYSERNRHCVGGCRGSLVRCSARPRTWCLVCVELSPTRLSRAVLSGAYSVFAIVIKLRDIADGTDGRRSGGGAGARDHVTKRCPNTSDHPPGSGATHSTWTSTSATPRSAFTARSLASRSVRSRSTTSTTDTARKSITPSRECWAAHWAATSVPRNSA